jgi:dolichol-phosphate mannosyltransferase
VFIYYLLDRSEDLTEIKLRKIARQDSRVKVIVFGKEAGHQMALMAGLKMSRPDATTVMLDGDMQHPPALIPVMIQDLGQEFQIVQSLRKKSADKRVLVRLATKYYFRVFSKLAGVTLESGFTDFRVVSPEVKKLIAQNYLDKKPFIRGYLSWLDLPTKIVEFEASPRSFGKTNFSFRRLASMATSGILNFSVVPLRVLMRVGIILSILSILTAFFLMVLRLMNLIDVPGYASISISILTPMISAIICAVSPMVISKLLPMLITSPTDFFDSATEIKPRTVSITKLKSRVVCKAPNFIFRLPLAI